MPILLFFVLMLPLGLVTLLIPASRFDLCAALIGPRQMPSMARQMPSKDSRHDR